MIDSIFPVGEKNDAFSEYFKGQSWLNMLTTEGVAIGNVTFEPKCRNNWHIHHKGGQILLCTTGRGFYQEWGKPSIELHSGDVVQIPPDVEHTKRNKGQPKIRRMSSKPKKPLVSYERFLESRLFHTRESNSVSEFIIIPSGISVSISMLSCSQISSN